MGDTIKFKQGLEADLPSRAEVGEPLWTIDTETLYIGRGDNKRPVPIKGLGGGGGSDIEIDDDSTTGTNVTWSAKKLQSMYNELTYTPIKITAFTSNVTKTVYEIGDTLTGIHFTWKTNKPSSSTYLTDCTVSSGTDADYGNALTSTKTFTLTVSDEKGAKDSSSITIYFVNPFYYGTFSDTLTVSGIISQNKLVQTKGNKSITLSYQDKKVFFAYPKSYGALRDIKDNNGFSYIKDFTINEMTINGTLYYVYTLDESASVDNITYSFSF